MENFKIESSYLKLYYEFRAFITCAETAIYRPDYQKFLMWPLIKRIGRAFKTLSRAFETKSSAECLKSSAACLCYNTAHVVPISDGNSGPCQSSMIQLFCDND